MKKNLLIIMSIIILILLGIFVYRKNLVNETQTRDEPKTDVSSSLSNTEGIKVALSLEDKISENTAWCGTFNLIWNDLKNDLVKQDIVFTPQLEVVKNLNRETFHKDYLSEESYYKVYGTPSLELKEEIQKAIQQKFNETSDILDDFDWTNHNAKDYFLYAILKRDFEFPKMFSELENGNFGKYENVKYFGIDASTEEQVRNQVKVLYYVSKENFAIKLLTKGKDEVIIARGENQETFGDIFEEIKDKSENYEGEFAFGEEDVLKIPNIKFNLKEEFPELANQPFLFSNGDEYLIEKAMQTIQFELDKKGGKIKSEAGMMADNMALIVGEPREFLVEDIFTLFLLEKGKELPYFATKISDISKVQENVKELQKDAEKETTYFYGKVVENGKNSILVEPNEGEEIRKSADKISIGLGENTDYTYEIGTNVKITYNGVVMETYPAQVEPIDIELKSVEDFEIHFVDQSYESRGKVRPILEKTESSQYDYNIYAYLGEVNILMNGKEMPLREALLENRITMDEILAKANQDVEDKKISSDMYNDGGSMLYKYDDYTMIKVHNLDGNRDVYFGVPDMILNDLAV